MFWRGNPDRLRTLRLHVAVLEQLFSVGVGVRNRCFLKIRLIGSYESQVSLLSVNIEQ